MFYIDKLAYASKLSGVSVQEKLCFIGLPLLSALFLQSNLLNILIVCLMGIATLHFAKIKIWNYLKLLLVPAVFIIISVLSLCIIELAHSNGPILFSFTLFSTAYGLSINSLYAGLSIFLRAIAGISCLYFLALNTPLNALLGYLQSLGVSSIILTLMDFIYRFIFIIYEQACITHVAQLSRMGHSSFLKSLSAYYQLFSSVFIRSFIKIDRINNALISRGFDNNFSYQHTTGTHSSILQKMTGLYVLILLLSFFLEKGYI